MAFTQEMAGRLDALHAKRLSFADDSPEQDAFMEGPEGTELLYLEADWEASLAGFASAKEAAYGNWTVFQSHVGTIAAKAYNEDMRDLSDAEIERVFGNCANPILCKVVVKRWRNLGHTVKQLMDFAEGVAA